MFIHSLKIAKRVKKQGGAVRCFGQIQRRRPGRTPLHLRWCSSRRPGGFCAQRFELHPKQGSRLRERFGSSKNRGHSSTG